MRRQWKALEQRVRRRQAQVRLRHKASSSIYQGPGLELYGPGDLVNNYVWIENGACLR